MIALWALAKGIKRGEAYDEAASWLGRDTVRPKNATFATAIPPWMPAATPVQLETEERVARELSDIAHSIVQTRPTKIGGGTG
jgi:hypothetical protein